jgi:Asp-tRNA(Asn)/Glu-tRNA(Gln) amidotransferase A subunit family amidase
VRLPSLFEPAIAAAEIILRVEAAAFHSQWFPARAQEYGARLRALIESGNSISAVEYIRARQTRCVAQQQMEHLWAQVDFIATPSTPTTAPEGLASTGSPAFNTPFSAFGNPAITLPSHYSESGLPAGFQLAAGRGSDTRLLRLASTLERLGFGHVTPESETRNAHVS